MSSSTMCSSGLFLTAGGGGAQHDMHMQTGLSVHASDMLLKHVPWKGSLGYCAAYS